MIDAVGSVRAVQMRFWSYAEFRRFEENMFGGLLSPPQRRKEQAPVGAGDAETGASRGVLALLPLVHILGEKRRTCAPLFLPMEKKQRTRRLVRSSSAPSDRAASYTSSPSSPSSSSSSSSSTTTPSSPLVSSSFRGGWRRHWSASHVFVPGTIADEEEGKEGRELAEGGKEGGPSTQEEKEEKGQKGQKKGEAGVADAGPRNKTRAPASALASLDGPNSLDAIDAADNTGDDTDVVDVVDMVDVVDVVDVVHVTIFADLTVIPSHFMQTILSWDTRIARLVDRQHKLVTANAYISTLGGGHFHCRHSSEARAMARKQMRIAVQLGDVSMAVQCHLHLAYTCIQLGELEEARVLITQQHAIACPLGDRHLVGLVEAAAWYLGQVVQVLRIPGGGEGGEAAMKMKKAITLRAGPSFDGNTYSTGVAGEKRARGRGAGKGDDRICTPGGELQPWVVPTGEARG